MPKLVSRLRGTGPIGWVYLTNLFLGFHFFLVNYVNSNFLGQYLDAQAVGIVFALGNILALVGFSIMPTLLKMFGNKTLAIVLASLQFCVFLMLATTDSPALILPLFALNAFIIPPLLYTIDVFLEALTEDESETGMVRGTLLTIASAASVISPVIAGFIITEANLYGRLYLVSALMLAPFIYIVATRFRTFSDPEYRIFRIGPTLNAIARSRGLRHVVMCQFLLRFYFAWMVVYMPIYLYTEIGFSWPEIGLIFSVMLLPYLFLELPAGILADKYWGEKELLTAGFVIAALASGTLVFFDEPILVLWMALLFATRVGASLIDIMTETHFFKHVRGGDTDTISVFRMLRPFAWLIALLAGTAALTLVSLKYLWVILALVMFYGLRHALAIVDTK